MSTSNTLAERQQALQQWAAQLLPQRSLGALLGPLTAVSGDASFRRYFRGHTANAPFILVDAPPNKEDCRPFVKVAELLLAAGVRVPRLVGVELLQGFMCLEDFGDQLLWPTLEQARVAQGFSQAQHYYQRCFAELLLLQQATVPADLPRYDEALLLREMRLFTEWCCGALLQVQLSTAEQDLLETTYAALAQRALAQPQVLVHRDYHSRNLMLLTEPGNAIGVIDFQDAVLGPWTYDLVSLLKDCYIEWPRDLVRAWALAYAEQAQQAGIVPVQSSEQVLRDFDWMGAQRHIKVLGIFSRLWLRDGKAGYLPDMALTFRYLQQVMNAEPAFAAFAAFLQQRIAPLLPEAVAAAQDAARVRGVLK